MTALLSAATVVVLLGLVGVIAGFLWFIGTMVLAIAELLSERIAPGAQAVAGHVAAMAPGIQQLDAAIAELT
jgi:hypothetical protein